MKETVERNGRFYTNEKGEIKTENEQLKEWLLIANKENERLKEEYVMLQNASDEVEEEKDKEIERLQDLCNKYEKEHKTTYEIWKKDIYLYNSLVDRIDKALSYLRDIGNWLRDDSSYRAKLIDILQGSDKD